MAWLCSLGAVACTQQQAAVAVQHGWTREAEIKVGRTPGPVVLGEQWAFVANMSDGTVTQIDRAGGRVIATISVADPKLLRDQGCAPDSVHAYYSGSWGWRACDTPYAIAWGDAALWALDNGARSLVKVDPATHAVALRIPLTGTGWAIAVLGTTAYVSGFAANRDLYEVDLRSGDVKTISDLDTGPATLAADAGGIWVACVRAGAGYLDRIDPGSGEVSGRYPIDWWSTAVVADQGAVFVRGTFGGEVSRVDETTGEIAWAESGPGFIGRQGIDQMGPASNGIWMSGPTTARVDLLTGGIVEVIRTPSMSAAYGDGEVWLVELNGSVAKFALK
jgi:DNA-binding beta-propeller fold protein YncE